MHREIVAQRAAWTKKRRNGEEAGARVWRGKSEKARACCKSGRHAGTSMQTHPCRHIHADASHERAAMCCGNGWQVHAWRRH